MALVYTGQCSFAGVNFAAIQTDGVYKRDFDDRTHYSAEDVPFSDDTVLQVGGNQSGEVAIAALVTEANYNSLLAKRRTRGAFTLHGTTRTATLLHVTDKRQRPNDYWLCTLTFYV